MITFSVGAAQATGYLARPAQSPAPAVLVLHAWWGLTPVFKSACDRLAGAGFVAFAPDLYAGKTATTIDEAKQLMQQRDSQGMEATALAALAFLRAQPAAAGRLTAALGFSMGAAWAIDLASAQPAEIAAAVLFYGSSGADFAAARAAFLGHFAEHDEWEPLEDVEQMAAAMRADGRDVTFYNYPGAQHWFAEPNRPEYDHVAAELAWERTIAFLHQQLARP